MTTFVLVPGMWLGAWAWSPVTAALRSGGHDVHPLTLSGLADRAHITGADLDTHTDDIVNLILAGELTDVRLVVHSYACVPGRAAADRLPDRIGRMIYVDSGPLPNGMSQADVGPPSTEDGVSIPPPDWTASDDSFAGLTSAQRTELARRATPHPLASATQKLDLRSESQPPSDIITSLMPEPVAQQMIDDDHPFFAGLDRSNYRLHALPTGHWPMFSRPTDLAALLATL